MMTVALLSFFFDLSARRCFSDHEGDDDDPVVDGHDEEEDVPEEDDGDGDPIAGGFPRDEELDGEGPSSSDSSTRRSFMSFSLVHVLPSPLYDSVIVGSRHRHGR